MTTRATAFGVGLLLAGLAGYAAIGSDDRISDTLCVNGHPARRSPYVVYGNLPLKPGTERDHWRPLSLGGEDVAARDPTRHPGPDNPGNVWYQPLSQALKKDIEERELAEAFCRGEISLDDAVNQLSKDWQ